MAPMPCRGTESSGPRDRASWLALAAMLVACGRDAALPSSGDATNAAGPASAADPIVCRPWDGAHADADEGPFKVSGEMVCPNARAEGGSWRAPISIEVPPGSEPLRLFRVELRKLTPKVLEREWVGEGGSLADLVKAPRLPMDLAPGGRSELELEGFYRVIKNEDPDARANFHLILVGEHAGRPHEIPVIVHIVTSPGPEIDGQRPRAPPGEPDKIREPEPEGPRRSKP